MNTEITQAHLVIVQELLEFMQARDWDIKSLEIRRYEKHEDDESGEEWQEKQYKWYLSIETQPRDQDKLPERVKAGLDGS